jgi:hypothetical protein
MEFVLSVMLGSDEVISSDQTTPLDNSTSDLRIEIRKNIAFIHEMLELFPRHFRSPYEDACLNMERTLSGASLPSLANMFASIVKLRNKLLRKTRAIPPPTQVLVKMQTYMYYFHKQFGLIRLQFLNPIPLPKGAIVCDLCRVPLSVGYQCVDHSGERDISSFDVGFSGFDLCIKCAMAQYDQHVSKTTSWVQRKSSSTYYPYGRIGGHSLTLVSQSEGSIELSISPPGQKITVMKGSGVECPCRVEYSPIDIPEDDCCICFEQLSDVDLGKQNAIRTPCGHIFHHGCIQKVRRAELSTTRRTSDVFRCPLCRAEVCVREVAGITRSQRATITFVPEKDGRRLKSTTPLRRVSSAASGVGDSSERNNNGGECFVFLTADRRHPETASSVVLRVSRCPTVGGVPLPLPRPRASSINGIKTLRK